MMNAATPIIAALQKGYHPASGPEGVHPAFLNESTIATAAIKTMTAAVATSWRLMLLYPSSLLHHV